MTGAIVCTVRLSQIRPQPLCAAGEDDRRANIGELPEKEETLGLAGLFPLLESDESVAEAVEA